MLRIIEMEANPRSNLRKGFPIKIGGYAVGGRNNNANENKCDINTSVRFRQRRNSDTSYDRSSIRRNNSKPPEVISKQLYSPLLGLRRRSVGGVQFVNLGIGNEERDKAEFSVLEKCQQQQKPSQKLSDPGLADNVTVQREKSAGKNVKNEEITENHQGDDNVTGGQDQELGFASDDNNPINAEGPPCVTNIPNSEVCSTINVNL